MNRLFGRPCCTWVWLPVIHMWKALPRAAPYQCAFSLWTRTAELIRQTPLPRLHALSRRINPGSLPVDFILSVHSKWITDTNRCVCDTIYFLGRVDWKLTRYLIHCDEIPVLLFYFGPVPGDEVNSEERQKTAGEEFLGRPDATLKDTWHKSCRNWCVVQNLPEEEHKYVQQSQAFKLLVENDACKSENAH